MSTLPLSFPRANVPWVEKDGVPTRDFYRLIYGLFQGINTLQQFPTDPTDLFEGQFWENTTSHQFKVYLNGVVKVVTVT